MSEPILDRLTTNHSRDMNQIYATNEIAALLVNGGRAIYQQTINWSNHSVTSGYYSTLKQARLSAIKIAKQYGYTIPKWYEFWRSSDTNILKWKD